MTEKDFETPQEPARILTRENWKIREEVKLEALLLAGINSGEPIEITPDYWENKRRQLVERHERSKTDNR